MGISLSASAGKARRVKNEVKTDSLLVMGDSLMAEYDYARAADCFVQRIGAQEDQQAARQKLGECYYRMQRYRDCIECMRMIDPYKMSHTGKRMMYYSYKALERTDSASVWGDLIQDYHPRDMEVAVSLARMYNDMKNPVAAMYAAQRYLTRDTTCIPAMRQLAYGRYLSDLNAIEIYDKILARDSMDFEATFMKGMCLSMKDRQTQALPYLQRAAAMKDYRHLPSVLRLALVSADLNDSINAERYLKAAEELITPDPEILYAIKKKQAMVYHTLGKWQMSANALLECIRLRPAEALAYYNVAELFRSLGDTTSQRLYLKRFLEAVPNDKMSTTEEGKKVIAEAKKKLKGH